MKHQAKFKAGIRSDVLYMPLVRGEPTGSIIVNDQRMAYWLPPGVTAESLGLTIPPAEPKGSTP